MRNWFKSDEAIVAEIHQAFNTYGDKLLLEAQNILNKKNDISKGTRLSKLGFTKTKEAVSAAETISQKKEAEQFQAIIRKYATKYPLYRFITEKGVTEICEKYNLIMGGVEHYIGTVPDKNLSEIENFNIPEEQDLVYLEAKWGFNGDIRRINYEEYKLHGEVRNRYYSVYKDTKFKICAPSKDFDKTGMKIEDRKLLREVPDPVVLFPINHGYLIVSAWGPEASDEKVVNSKYN